MKIMRCEQLGGPCDHRLRGDTADDVIKAQDQHLNEMVAGGDDNHAAALEEMQGRWERPAAGMEWYQDVQSRFSDLPDD